MRGHQAISLGRQMNRVEKESFHIRPQVEIGIYILEWNIETPSQFAHAAVIIQVIQLHGFGHKN